MLITESKTKHKCIFLSVFRLKLAVKSRTGKRSLLFPKRQTLQTHQYSLLYKDSMVEQYHSFNTSVIFLREIYYIILLGQARIYYCTNMHTLHRSTTPWVESQKQAQWHEDEPKCRRLPNDLPRRYETAENYQMISRDVTNLLKITEWFAETLRNSRRLPNDFPRRYEPVKDYRMISREATKKPRITEWFPNDFPRRNEPAKDYRMISREAKKLPKITELLADAFQLCKLRLTAA